MDTLTPYVRTVRGMVTSCDGCRRVYYLSKERTSLEMGAMSYQSPKNYWFFPTTTTTTTRSIKELSRDASFDFTKYFYGSSVLGKLE
jgi:hypothetical protein